MGYHLSRFAILLSVSWITWAAGKSCYRSLEACQVPIKTKTYLNYKWVEGRPFHLPPLSPLRLIKPQTFRVKDKSKSTNLQKSALFMPKDDKLPSCDQNDNISVSRIIVWLGEVFSCPALHSGDSLTSRCTWIIAKLGRVT